MLITSKYVDSNGFKSIVVYIGTAGLMVARLFPMLQKCRRPSSTLVQRSLFQDRFKVQGHRYILVPNNRLLSKKYLLFGCQGCYSCPVSLRFVLSAGLCVTVNICFHFYLKSDEKMKSKPFTTCCQPANSSMQLHRFHGRHGGVCVMYACMEHLKFWLLITVILDTAAAGLPLLHVF